MVWSIQQVEEVTLLAKMTLAKRESAFSRPSKWRNFPSVPESSERPQNLSRTAPAPVPYYHRRGRLGHDQTLHLAGSSEGGGFLVGDYVTVLVGGVRGERVPNTFPNIPRRDTFLRRANPRHVRCVWEISLELISVFFLEALQTH